MSNVFRPLCLWRTNFWEIISIQSDYTFFHLLKLLKNKDFGQMEEGDRKGEAAEDQNVKQLLVF